MEGSPMLLVLAGNHWGVTCVYPFENEAFEAAAKRAGFLVTDLPKVGPVIQFDVNAYTHIWMPSHVVAIASAMAGQGWVFRNPSGVLLYTSSEYEPIPGWTYFPEDTEHDIRAYLEEIQAS